MHTIPQIVIPEFDKKEFQLTPHNSLCEAIDSTRLMVEILGGLTSSSDELNKSEYASKIDMDGQFALLLRYKREKDGKYYPSCVLSFDIDNHGNIAINQIQGTKNRHVAFRFHSSFNHLAFYLKLIEETFIKKGIYVGCKKIPDGVEGASHSSKAYSSYNILATAIIGLNNKYGITQKK